MNSRERVNVTLNHEEPDKIPIDLGGNQSSIHRKASKLRIFILIVRVKYFCLI